MSGPTYSFKVPGVAVGAGRPRASKVGSFIRMYTPEKTKSYENRVALFFGTAYPEATPIEGPFRIAVKVICPLRASDYKPKGGLRKSGQRKLDGIERPLAKPDLDNVAKSVMDALNKIAYVDDSHCVALSIEKAFGLEPEAQIEIWEV